jgi:predicted RNA-binding protein YlqC (UPF0109 family)
MPQQAVSPTAKTEKFMLDVVSALVKRPESIEITTTVPVGDLVDTTILIKVKIHDEDVGRVLGKKGRLIIALRELVGAVAYTECRCRTIVDVVGSKPKRTRTNGGR